MDSSNPACCTCATLLSTISPIYNPETEKPLVHNRHLECCSRVICGNCIAKNSRFATYCPFCQISTHPSPLPQGLRDPPSYTTPPLPPPSSSSQAPPAYSDELPPYTSIPHKTLSYAPLSEKEAPPAEDVLHFLDHAQDTVSSLSLRYGVPLHALRRANNLTSDHLLRARRTIIIPGEFYKGGTSLSPRPVEGEDEERRKALVRRWMVACKVSEYDVALLYLEQAEYDLEVAIEGYREDERWERDHPLEITGKGKGKGKTRHEVGKRRFTGLKT